MCEHIGKSTCFIEYRRDMVHMVSWRMGEVVIDWRMLDPVQRFLMRPDQVGPFSQWHGGLLHYA